MIGTMSVLGFALGAAMAGPAGGIAGAALAFLATRLHGLRQGLRALQGLQALTDQRVEALDRRLRSTAPTTPPPSSEPVLRAERPAQTAGPPLATPAAPATAAPPVATTPPPASLAGQARAPRATPRPVQSAPPTTEDDTVGMGPIDAAWTWLAGGHTITRVGTLVLLVGVTLLLRYAAEHAMFPVELRLAGAAAVSVALVLVGLHYRVSRPGFGLTLQAGGLAALYLVIFFAYHSYGLLPVGLAFALLAGIAVAGIALSLLQHSMPLVVIGQLGGFLAPLLASTGSGQHVALFSYYLLLNLGVLAVAWKRAWRALNVLGFLFTFGIGTAWGVLQYRPAQFASTEPFLIAFFLIYVAVPLMYALRHRETGWVDASLVYGPPLAFLGLQRALVCDVPFAMAYTTLGMAALYAGLAYLLARRAPLAMRAMSQSLRSLAVGLATLAIPYGLDNAGLSGAAWAVEGAGLYWVGLQQQRPLSRIAALGLQLLGGSALLLHTNTVHGLPIMNTPTLGALLLVLACFFIAFQSFTCRRKLPASEVRAAQALTAWALLFVLIRGAAEIETHLDVALRPGALLALLGTLSATLELLARRLRWPTPHYAARLTTLLLLPAVGAWNAHMHTGLLTRGGWFGWPVYFASVAYTLRGIGSAAAGSGAVGGRAGAVRYLHPVALWGATAWLVCLLLDVAGQMPDLGDGWRAATPGAALAAVVGLALWLLRRFHRADPAIAASYRGPGLAAVMAAAMLWILGTTLGAPGDSTPLPYLPLLNPVDIAMCLCLLAALAWFRHLRFDHPAEHGLPADLQPMLRATWYAMGFVWFNGLLARSVHHYAGVEFDARSLWQAPAMQAACSISWAVLGLGLTVVASRRSARLPWMVGVGLLGAVVLKLFLVDIGQLAALAKIGTFLAVGALLILVGYHAPVPPAAPPPPGGDGRRTSPAPAATVPGVQA